MGNKPLFITQAAITRVDYGITVMITKGQDFSGSIATGTSTEDHKGHKDRKFYRRLRPESQANGNEGNEDRWSAPDR